MNYSNQLENFQHLPGKNCVTTALRNILNFWGYRFREALIFGISEGLGFQFKKVAGLENPYLSGVGNNLVANFCSNLRLEYEETTFENDQEAHADLQACIDKQEAVIIHLDLYYLPYFESKSHFAGHRVIPVGYDDHNIYLADTGFEKIQQCPIENLIKARSSAHPPFEPKRCRLKITNPGNKPFVEQSITKALYNMIQKFAKREQSRNLDEIFEFRDNISAYHSLRQLFIQIEKAGTGGGLSRRLFAEFLDQAFQIYSREIYDDSKLLFNESAQLWRQIAVDARKGKLNNLKETTAKIYQLELKGLKTLSAFESDDV